MNFIRIQSIGGILLFARMIQMCINCSFRVSRARITCKTYSSGVYRCSEHERIQSTSTLPRIRTVLK